jgi:hypothetical protein
VELREKVRENGEFLINLEEELMAEGGVDKPVAAMNEEDESVSKDII